MLYIIIALVFICILEALWIWKQARELADISENFSNTYNLKEAAIEAVDTLMRNNAALKIERDKYKQAYEGSEKVRKKLYAEVHKP